MQTLVDNNKQNTVKVSEGIEFLLSHFEGRQKLFPRKMSTSLSLGRQFTVYNEEQILNECIKADFIDCRLNAYPILLEDNEYTITTTVTTQAPNIILIDLDLCKNKDNNLALLQLNKTLTKTLNTIKEKLNACKPTVLWTGNGYHIYIVLNTRPLELFTEFRELSKKPSEEFLKFAEITFSNHKADPEHNPAFKSYLLRIPYTFNSKCMHDNSKDLEVKTVQKFNTSTTPTINASLLREFRLYLADLDIKNKKIGFAKRQVSPMCSNSSSACTIPQSYQWIEGLLKTAISDHRKFTLELILTPYLVVIKRLPFNEAYRTIKEWSLKCHSLRTLDHSFDIRIKTAIEKSIQNGIPPIRKETIAKNYPAWYNDFRQWHLFNQSSRRGQVIYDSSQRYIRKQA